MLRSWFLEDSLPFKEINYDPKLWQSLIALPYTIFLDGNERFSYIGFEPKKIYHELPNSNALPKHEHYTGLPPFQGGLIGFLSYELGHCFNPCNIRLAKPKVIIGLYENVIAFDHKQKKSWLIWRGNEPEIPKYKKSNVVNKFSEIKSQFSKNEYLDIVSNIRERIANGDVYQVNISNEFTTLAEFDLVSLYNALQKIAPAPFSCLANFKDFAILSSSPERFLKIEDNTIITSPIKGTVKRENEQKQDSYNKNWLLNSAKDRAENTMIVDLMRNDLSKICLDDSIHVDELCGLYSFSNVHHLISTISGKLKPGIAPIDVFQATMAAGSITGAPKAMAMDIISQIEQTPRKAYCGHIFWQNFQGMLDSNILIRTITAKENQLSFRAGGGITYSSIPQKEYEEMLAKASIFFNLCKKLK